MTVHESMPDGLVQPFRPGLRRGEEPSSGPRRDRILCPAFGCAPPESESRQAATGSPPARRIRAADLDELRLGESTAADVERLFGTPDVRTPDGALVYGTGPAAPTVTFRFESGRVARICRARP
ncbi:MAG TPA: hypothetical protein VFD84_16790 [Candidatus Binatia bacterium]|nr:hypothetical protein [Candidatus Binatia bacterium]